MTAKGKEKAGTPARPRHYEVAVVFARAGLHLDEHRIRIDGNQLIANYLQAEPAIEVIHTQGVVFVVIELKSPTGGAHLAKHLLELFCENLVHNSAQYGLVDASTTTSTNIDSALNKQNDDGCA